jgi:hypothetical protein
MKANTFSSTRFLEPTPMTDTSRHCAVCGLVQFSTDSGLCCGNGHGGADSLTRAEAEQAFGLEHVAQLVKENQGQTQGVTCPEDEPDSRVDAFLNEVRHEIMRARRLFPGDRIRGLAFGEEVGELFKAMLDESSSRVRKEAVQTAAMAARIALEGDGSVREWREEKGLDPIH